MEILIARPFVSGLSLFMQALNVGACLQNNDRERRPRRKKTQAHWPAGCTALNFKEKLIIIKSMEVQTQPLSQENQENASGANV